MRGRARQGSQSALVTGLALALLLLSAPSRADLAAGRDAFNRGDFDRAEQEWRPLAERGNGEAEFGLGEVYEQGKGDYKKAETWYAKAAEKDNLEARYRLALIALAGNSEIAPDPVKAYKWAILASKGKNEWAQLAQDLRALLEAQLTAGEQAQGKKQADAWGKPKEEPKIAVVTPRPVPLPSELPNVQPPLPPAPGVAPARPGALPPGFPKSLANLPWIPNLPKLGLPPIPGQPSQPPPNFSPAGVQVPPPSGQPPEPDMIEILKRIDCAWLRKTVNAQGRPVISGTVPDEGERAKLLRISNSITAESRPEVHVNIVPPPLCRSLLEFNAMRTSSLTADGLEARLLSGSELREGDPIRIEVKAGNLPLNVRIDYFSLSGEVLHMLPTGAAPIARLPAGASRTFQSGGAGKEWLAGGAPFGTELIAVIATPNPLDLDKRPEVERASDYLRALEKALQRSRNSAPGSALLSTILVHTSAK